MQPTPFSAARRAALAGLLLVSLPMLSAAPASAASYTLSTLFNFDGTAHGATPISDLTTDAQGNIYGTTSSGGSGNHGTVFQYKPSTQTFTTLVKFKGTNGSNPYGGVLPDGSGNLYGTTYDGGSGGNGTLYKYNLAAKTLTVLVAFKGAINGSLPIGDLASDGNGHLYGVTQAGGGKGDGTLYKYTVSTKTLATLVTFNKTNGATPYAGVTLDGSGNLYGTTYMGGSANTGVLYRYNLTSKMLTVLHQFVTVSGTHPRASLTYDSSLNVFYGTAETGGNNTNSGTLFQYAPSTSTFTVLHTFSGPDGASPYALVTVNNNGVLFSTTQAGGQSTGGQEDGTVFSYDPGVGQFTTLVRFDGALNSQPFGGVLLDGSGNLFGTTAFSGSHNDGTLYELVSGP